VRRPSGVPVGGERVLLDHLAYAAAVPIVRGRRGGPPLGRPVRPRRRIRNLHHHTVGARRIGGGQATLGRGDRPGAASECGFAASAVRRGCGAPGTPACPHPRASPCRVSAALAGHARPVLLPSCPGAARTITIEAKSEKQHAQTACVEPHGSHPFRSVSRAPGGRHNRQRRVPGWANRPGDRTPGPGMRPRFLERRPARH
jgi:hypothetical protein